MLYLDRRIYNNNNDKNRAKAKIDIVKHGMVRH